LVLSYKAFNYWLEGLILTTGWMQFSISLLQHYFDLQNLSCFLIPRGLITRKITYKHAIGDVSVKYTACGQ
jgi:hypothetical protein